MDADRTQSSLWAEYHDLRDAIDQSTEALFGLSDDAWGAAQWEVLFREHTAKLRRMGELTEILQVPAIPNNMQLRGSELSNAVIRTFQEPHYAG